MKENGNPNQWFDYKPLKEDIIFDISILVISPVILAFLIESAVVIQLLYA